MPYYAKIPSLPKDQTTIPTVAQTRGYGDIINSFSPYDSFFVNGYPDVTIGSYKNFSIMKVGFFHAANQASFIYNRIFACLKPAGSTFNNASFRNDSNSNIVITNNCNTDSGVIDNKTGMHIFYFSETIAYPTSFIVEPRETSTVQTGINEFVNYNFNDGLWIDTSDPYARGDFTEKGGGEGDFDGTSDPVDFPALPTISVSDTGFINIYAPTLQELQSLSSYMWTNPLFDLSNYKALFINPMDCILNLSLLPISVTTAGRQNITVGNLSTDVEMTLVNGQFYELDCGTLNINEFWGSYLDYSPYTKLSIFLPYIGNRQLDIDECMNKSIHVKYQIDIFTGACSAFIKCGDSIMYTFSGQCSSNIPISGANYSTVINGILSAAATGIGVISGGLSAPLAMGGIASISSTVTSSKPHIMHSGSMSGNSGFLSVQTPYLQLSRPRQAVPEQQNIFEGYPSYITAELNNLTGFTIIESIHFSNFSGTDEELQETINLLKSGVIF